MSTCCAWRAKQVTRQWWPVISLVARPFLPAGMAPAYFGDGASAMVEGSFLFFASPETALLLAAEAAIPLAPRWAERRCNELEISYRDAGGR